MRQGFVDNIEERTLENEFFREVLYTGPKSQLVVMALKPGEEIGEEVHEDHDQFFRFEQGEGKVVLDGVEKEVAAEYAVVVPAGMKHNVVNTSETEMLKLYTIYSPPEHKDKVIHKTKEEALNDKTDHFDGKTSE